MSSRHAATLFAVATLVLGSLAACGGTTEPVDDEPTGNDEAELKKCAGIAGIACPSGYECVLTAHHPDATGTCKKKKASTCASMTCPHGQHCMVMGSPPAPMCM